MAAKFLFMTALVFASLGAGIMCTWMSLRPTRPPSLTTQLHARPLTMVEELARTGFSDPEKAWKDLSTHSLFWPRAERVKTMADLELCRVSKGGPVGWRIECEDDSTCVKCQAPWSMKLSERILADFKNLTRKEKRLAELMKHIPSSGPIMFMIADVSALYFALNWMCGCDRFGIRWRERLLLGVGSEETATMAKTLGITALNTARLYHSTVQDPADRPKTSKPRMQELQRATAAMKTLNILILHDLVVSLQREVLFIDADVIFFRDPLPFLTEYPPNRFMDFMTSFAPRDDSQGPANSGIIFARPSFRTTLFLDKLLLTLPILLWGDDQVVWNTLLRHFLFRQVRWENLPITFFSLRANLTDYPQMFATHFVAASKFWVMKEKSVWFLDQNCTYFADLKSNFAHTAPHIFANS